MEGLINFAHEVAAVVLVWLGVSCYIGGAAAVIGGAWMLTEAHRHGSRHRFRPWMAWGVFWCGFLFLGFPDFLNLGTATIGGSARAGVGDAMTSYAAPDGGSWLGRGPLETLVAIIQSFILFFRAIGASFVFQAIAGWKGVFKGTRRHSWWPPTVKAACGIVVINVDTVAAALMRSAGGA